MKKLRKSLGLFAAAFAMCMVFALGAKVNAAQKSIEGGILIDEGNLTTQPMVGNMATDNFAISSAGIYTSSISVAVVCPTDADYVEVELCDRNGAHIASDDGVLSHAFFDNVKNNTVYLYRARAYTRDYDYTTGQYVTTYGNWSGFRAFVKIKTKQGKSKISGSRKQISFKLPKIKGVKKYTITMSTKEDKGFKKIATAKPGKKITVSKFKKKNLKRFKTYYLRITPKLNCKISSDLIGTLKAY